MIPIRKVKPTQVALTSYYNKTFVQRSDRKTNDYGGWITRQIIARGLDDADNTIHGLRISNVFNQKNKTPRLYAMLARRIRQVEVHDFVFNFDFLNRHEIFKKADFDVDAVETDNMVMVGYRGKAAVLMDMDNTLYIEGEVLGDISTVFGLDTAKAPLEVVDVTIANKAVPLGFVLAYQFGLTKLIEMLGCEVTRFRRGERFVLQSDEFALTFEDEVLVFPRQDVQAMMILGGLQRFHKALKDYSVWDFDLKDVYFNLLEVANMTARHLREIDTLFPAWIDPITRDILIQMGEPTTFDGLLLRAVELLQDDYALSEVDGAEMRYRGYERFSGMVYGELMRAAKIYNARPGTDHRVELNPHAVWQRIVQDPSVANVEEANPIQSLREQEVMTYRGDGGRSGQSMVQRTRIYSDADLGVVSESTQDSGDVGVVAYLSPNPNIIDMFGMTRRYDPEKDGPASILSSSTLNAPAADRDD